MTNKPLVSIIIPVYNAEKTIQRCLDAIHTQTYSELEVLFIDDCCTDNSFFVIEEYIAKHFVDKIATKILHHEKNRGVAAARNTGLDNASGDYIYYIDSDDWMEPHLVEALVLEAQKNNQDIVGCEWYLTYNKNERYMKQATVSSPDDAFRKMAGGVLRWNLWLFLVKRALYVENNIRFTEGKNMGEDMMIMGKLFLCANSAIVLHQPLYHYIQTNESSLTKDVSENHMTQIIANLKDLEQFVLQKRGKELAQQIHFLKLNVKLPLLITDNSKSHRRWKQLFPESNQYVMKNKLLPMRTRILQWLGANRCFWIVKLYYKFVFKLVYGIVYR